MNILQMRYFITVAEQMNFTRAAERLYVSQPAVSKQIALLERELGFFLIDRSRSGSMHLTAEGEIYLELFRGFLDKLDETAARLQLAKEKKPALRIGIAEGWELPDGMRRILENISGSCQLEAQPFRVLAQKLLDGELDLAMATSSPVLFEQPRLSHLPLADLEGLFLLSKRHKKRGEHFQISDLYGDCMYLLEDPEGPPVDNTRLIDVLGFDPEVRFLPNRDSIILAIESGKGFSYFDEWVRYRAYSALTALPAGRYNQTWLFFRSDAPELLRGQAEQISSEAAKLRLKSPDEERIAEN